MISSKALRLVSRPRGAAALAAVVCTLAAVASGGASVAAAAKPTDPLARVVLLGHKPTGQVSAIPSETRPHWACPQSFCNAIVDPRPYKRGSAYVLPSGRELEGSGELGGYSPADLKAAYKFPVAGGADQTIALVDEYDYPGAEADLAVYRQHYGLPPCTKANGCFKRLNESGEEANYPPQGKEEPGESETEREYRKLEKHEEQGWREEAALDLDMASAACPACRIMLVEAHGLRYKESEVPAYFQYLPNSVTTAVSHGATEVSSSYAFPDSACAESPEIDCSKQAKAYSHAGVLFTAGSGDDAWDNYFRDPTIFGIYGSPSFPASLGSVVAVGGTALTKAATPRGWSESVWNESGRGTGSGCSRVEPRPSWQTEPLVGNNPACTGRVTNDVAAVAACSTPVSVYSGSVSGGWIIACGTSASSPLVAGIMAHASATVRSRGPQEFWQSRVGTFDVTEGWNVPEVEEVGQQECFDVIQECLAKTFWDGPTGTGTPLWLPGVATPHWYGSGKLIGAGSPTAVAATGSLTLTGNAGSTSVTCKVKASESVENPTGGEAGTGQVTTFALSGCKFTGEGCTKATATANPPWSGTLVFGGSPDPIREEISGVKLTITCIKPRKEVLDVLTGTLTPSVGSSAFEFGSGSSELAQSTAPEPATVAGSVKLKGPKVAKTITAQAP